VPQAKCYLMLNLDTLVDIREFKTAVSIHLH